MGIGVISKCTFAGIVAGNFNVVSVSTMCVYGVTI